MANQWNGYLKREDIEEEMKLIEGSLTDYITPTAKIYKLMRNGLYFEKKTQINKHNGYIYVGITFPDGNKQRRLHVLLAKAFIPNPNNYNVVGHKNNIKHDCRIENLYWTTVSENTKKAYDDGLTKNDKGYDDSQSMPVIVYDLNMKELFRFGSVSICSKELNISKNTILNQCRGNIRTKPRCGYYFKFQ